MCLRSRELELTSADLPNLMCVCATQLQPVNQPYITHPSTSSKCVVKFAQSYLRWSQLTRCKMFLESKISCKAAAVTFFFVAEYFSPSSRKSPEMCGCRPATQVAAAYSMPDTVRMYASSCAGPTSRTWWPRWTAW